MKLDLVDLNTFLSDVRLIWLANGCITGGIASTVWNNHGAIAGMITALSVGLVGMLIGGYMEHKLVLKTFFNKED